MLAMNEPACPTSRAVYARDVGIFASSAPAHRITPRSKAAYKSPTSARAGKEGAPAERFRSIERLGTCWGRRGRSCRNVGDERPGCPTSRAVYARDVGIFASSTPAHRIPPKLSTTLLPAFWQTWGSLYGCRTEIEGSAHQGSAHQGSAHQVNYGLLPVVYLR